MGFKMFSVITLVLLSINTAQAELYIEASAEAGGEDLITTNSADSISAGGGIKFAIGVQSPLNYSQSTDIRLTVGYLSDSILASNGEAEFNTVTFDAMLVSYFWPHSFGLGATMHMSPQYRDNVMGYASEVIDYDDAIGLVFQYSYHFVPGLELGVRYTDLTYTTGSLQQDAGSLGIFISNGF